MAGATTDGDREEFGMKTSFSTAELISSYRSRQKTSNRRNTMNKAIRLALVGASILALTSPVLARTAAKSDRMTSHLATGVGERHIAPASLPERAPEQALPVYGWNAIGFDRASSPHAGGVS
jgi:hypothetical protein